jgi:hypothetical protein
VENEKRHAIVDDRALVCEFCNLHTRGSSVVEWGKGGKESRLSLELLEYTRLQKPGVWFPVPICLHFTHNSPKCLCSGRRRLHNMDEAVLAISSAVLGVSSFACKPLRRRGWSVRLLFHVAMFPSVVLRWCWNIGLVSPSSTWQRLTASEGVV